MLDKKELKKFNQELVELHKRCIISYFAQESVKFRTKKKFFKLYDIYINYKNIREYFFRDIPLFVKCLVLDRLDEIRDYYSKPKKKKRRK